MREASLARERMLRRHLAGRGIHDAAPLAAMSEVPRERFVPAVEVASAYEDSALPIGCGQTISQPYIVALMVQALELSGTERVLEVGTGSGYAAAVLSRCCAEVYTIERHATLARRAGEALAELGYSNVHVRPGDGTLGWEEHAPFDAVVVAAGSAEVPEALLEQLAVGGRLVMPVGSASNQELVRLTRVDALDGAEAIAGATPDGVAAGEFERDFLGPVRFVPLVSGGE